MIENFEIDENATMYDYCKRIVLLYEMESNLYEMAKEETEELRDKIICEILDIQDELRKAIIKNKIQVIIIKVKDLKMKLLNANDESEIILQLNCYNNKKQFILFGYDTDTLEESEEGIYITGEHYIFGD